MISIVIPTFQEEKRLPRTLDSIIKRLTLPYELIISDGNSTDRTLELAKPFNAKICVYTGTTRQKPGVGRNDGARLVTGEFIAFIDSGCTIADPDAFFTAALKDFEDPALMGLTAWIRVPPEEETVTDRFFLGFMNNMYLVHNNILHRGGAPGRFQMVRTSAFRAIKGYREDLTFYEDVDLFERLNNLGRTYTDRKLTVYHQETRAKTIGWVKINYLWMMNTMWQRLFKKTFSRVWDPIR